MGGLHDPRPHEERYVSPSGLVVKQTSCAPSGRARTCCWSRGCFSHQLKGPIIIPMEASFISQTTDFRQEWVLM